MALSIKSDEADRLARELAAESGETLTQAVENALRERLGREHARHAASMRTRLRRLAADVAAMRVADARTLSTGSFATPRSTLCRSTRTWPAVR